MMLLKWWKRAQPSKRMFAMLSLFLMVFYILILLGPGFPDVARGARPGLSTSAHGHVESGLGELGLLMISMLPDDLSFTVFSPSEKAFEHVLKLANSSLVVDKRNDTLAILSRIMAFAQFLGPCLQKQCPCRKS
ncbi:hypothetical protein HPP92_006382 [Vanilla planifolia]|uniref:Uncharacterized protein n=1 Tax=Vanilla planifolia TaxID=51239 RepID=A0A835V6Q7_VANPL|nr:hypothetical protein HPP92_006382 [Vanilla planifolia]